MALFFFKIIHFSLITIDCKSFSCIRVPANLFIKMIVRMNHRQQSIPRWNNSSVHLKRASERASVIRALRTERIRSCAWSQELMFVKAQSIDSFFEKKENLYKKYLYQVEPKSLPDPTQCFPIFDGPQWLKFPYSLP